LNEIRRRQLRIDFRPESSHLASFGQRATARQAWTIARPFFGRAVD
jgi:hypothetical protein